MPKNKTTVPTPIRNVIAPLFLIILGIFLISYTVWQLVISNPAQPQSVDAPQTSPLATRVQVNAAPIDNETALRNIPRVSLEEAKKAFDQKTAIFVDVRSNSSYQSAHIKNAIHIPLDKLDDAAKTLDPDEWIIPYCT